MFCIAGAHVGRSGHMLELIEYVAPRGETSDTRTKNTGAAHLAVEVDDIHAEFARITALGVRFRSSVPVAIEAGHNRGGYTIYLSDPDDITLEIIQPPPPLG
jgi:lactoylglutathione lyase